MMKSKTLSIAKGIGLGLAVGGAVGLVGGAMTQPQYQRTAKKGISKAVKLVGNVLESIS